MQQADRFIKQRKRVNVRVASSDVPTFAGTYLSTLLAILTVSK